MVRIALALILALGIAVPVASGATRARTQLTITVWPEGVDGASTTRTLRCGPTGGTLVRPARACTRLAGLTNAFAVPPKEQVCTMIYGGPQVARVVGSFNGRRVWMTFKRGNGCEIAAWNRLAFLFGAVKT